MYIIYHSVYRTYNLGDPTIRYERRTERVRWRPAFGLRMGIVRGRMQVVVRSPFTYFLVVRLVLLPAVSPAALWLRLGLLMLMLLSKGVACVAWDVPSLASRSALLLLWSTYVAREGEGASNTWVDFRATIAKNNQGIREDVGEKCYYYCCLVQK